MSLLFLKPSFADPRSLSGLVSWHDAQQRAYADGAMLFTAADKEWLTIADASQTGLDILAADLTILLWYKPTTVALRTLVCKGGSTAGDPGYKIDCDATGHIVANLSNGGTLVTATSTTTLSAGVAAFVVVKWDRDGNLTIQINNGAAEGTADISALSASINSTLPFYLGYDSIAGTVANGMLDEVVVYAKKTSTAEDTWLYNSGSGRIYSDTSNIDAPATILTSLVSWWGGVEGTGIRYDQHGSNHLTQAFGELTTNGTFTGNSTGWTEGTGWAYGVNNEVATAASGDLSQEISATVNKLYVGSHTISGYVGGSVRQNFGGVNGTTRSAGGTYTEYVRATAAGSLVLETVTDLTATLDDVSQKAAEILGTSGIAAGLARDANKAVQLNGTNQYLSYTGTAFNPGTGDWTLVSWVYCDKLPAAGLVATIFSAGTAAAGNDYYWSYVCSDGSFGVEVNDSTEAVTKSTSAGVVTPGNWYLVITKFDRDGNLSIKVNDGAAVTQSIAAKSTSIDPGNLYVGRYAAAATNYFSGRIDNAFYVNRFTTDAEDTALFNGGSGWQWAEFATTAALVGLTSSVVKVFLGFDTASALGTDDTGNGNTFTASGTPTQTYGVNYLLGEVSRWEDLSGNGYHLTSGSIAARPAYISPLYSSRPGALFNGTGCQLTTASYASLAGDLTVDTVFYATAAPSADATLIDLAQAGASGLQLIMQATTGKVGITNNGGPGASVLTAGSKADSVPHSLMVTRSGSTYSVYVDGALVGSDATGTAPTYTRFSKGAKIGGTAFLHCDILGSQVYNRALAGAEIAQLYNWDRIHHAAA